MRKHQLTAFGVLVRRTPSFGRLSRSVEIVRAWPKVAGPLISSHLAPVHYWDGTLYLVADQSVWGHQLSFLAPDLLAGFERVLGRSTVKELKLSSHGPLPDSQTGGGGPAGAATTPPSPPRAALPATEEQAISKEAQHWIANPELAERFAAMERIVKSLQLGRRRAGHRPCVICRVPHPGPGSRCRLCRSDRPS